MPEWLLQATGTMVFSLVVAVCTAIITVRLSLRRFRAEKWWERKAEAYSRIVEALHGVVEYFSELADEQLMMKQLDEQRKKQLTDEYLRAYRELKIATGIGAFIISDEVAEVLANLEARPRLNPDECAWFEIYDTDSETYKEALNEIRRLAKKDLEV